MNPIVKSLLEFNEAFEIPYLTEPGLSSEELIELRIKLLSEEVEEYAEAVKNMILQNPGLSQPDEAPEPHADPHVSALQLGDKVEIKLRQR